MANNDHLHEHSLAWRRRSASSSPYHQLFQWTPVPSRSYHRRQFIVCFPVTSEVCTQPTSSVINNKIFLFQQSSCSIVITRTINGFYGVQSAFNSSAFQNLPTSSLPCSSPNRLSPTQCSPAGFHSQLVSYRLPLVVARNSQRSISSTPSIMKHHRFPAYLVPPIGLSQIPSGHASQHLPHNTIEQRYRIICQ